MSVARKIKQRAIRRMTRVRSKIKKSGLPRLSIFRSLKQLYVQVIDDSTSQTLASCSTIELALAGKKVERAFGVGKKLAEKLLEKGLTQVVLDRGDKLFHGRIKAVAEGLKEGGIRV